MYKARAKYFGMYTRTLEFGVAITGSCFLSSQSRMSKMAGEKPFLGLRGPQLRAAMVLLVVAPSFILFGYNNGSTGGIATLESFVHVSNSERHSRL